MDLIEDIGPILGIVAFLGFAILALLIVLQAREVRRLREWAGRAPERALEADEAAQATAEARGEAGAEEAPGRIAAARGRLAGSLAPAWDALDRNSPVDPRWLLGVLLAAVIALGAVTSGFGLLGDDDEPVADGGRRDGSNAGQQQAPIPTVAVLNATQFDDLEPPVAAVPGIADVVAEEVLEPADFNVQTRTNAPAGEEKSLVMFAPDAEDAALDLAAAVEADLGTTEVLAMTEEIRAAAKGADLALLIGQDDADFGQGATGAVVP